jgi:signal transduction histidine kinase
MSISTVVDFFIHESRFREPRVLRRSRIFVLTCLLTSVFSLGYVVLSSRFDFPEGVWLMSFNVVAYLVLPFFMRTRVPITWLGNIFLVVGGSTVFIITDLTGGLWSSVCLWIIALPVVALLLVNRLSAIIWGAISLGVMIAFGWRAVQNTELPDYNEEMIIVYIAVITGLLLIILLISLVFEFSMTNALKEVESKNELLARKNETIAEQSEKLAELIEEKDYIIQILSHDLRSPLANISGLVDLIQIEESSEGRKTYLDLIARATGNANNLVNRVLEMDGADQTDLKAELQTLSITEVIEAVVRDSQEMASKKNITLQLQHQAKERTVLADLMCLTQVFQNLISNAIKFSPVDTRIQIVSSDVDTRMQVRIIDEGPGIRPNEEGKLFKKFSKLAARPTAGESSAGLGLSLVKRYAELTGAKVWYERNTGVGSTFVVEIPIGGY